MSNVYVRSGAGGAGTGADWANAYTTLAAAFSGKAAGDNFWISEDHAETQATTMQLSSPGSNAALCTAICVNHLGSVPPVSADLRTTATITTTGASAINIDNPIYFYGITFNCGTGAVSNPISTSASGEAIMIFVACALNKNGTTAGTAVNLGQSGGYTLLNNTSIGCGAIGDKINALQGPIVWKNTAVPITGTIPATVFLNQTKGLLLLEGLDFSAAGYASSQLFSSNSFGLGGNCIAKNCKFNSTLALSNTTPGSLGRDEFYNICSDSSGTNYRHEKYSYAGQQTVETTIVRTGGATDGTTPISWKIITTANSQYVAPYESISLAIKNSTTGANVTVTVYGIWGGGAVPKNDDIWIEVSYMGSASTPIATINVANTKADFLAANANQASDSSTWGGSTTAFKMSVTLSSPQPALKGRIYVRVKAAKAASTFYIDPAIVLS